MGTTKPTASVASQKKKKAGASLEDLEKIQVEGRAKHIKAANTTKKYGEFVRGGRAWMAKFEQQQKTTAEAAGASEQSPGASADNPMPDMEDEEEADSEKSPYEDPEFKKAFDDIPNKFSDKALALYVSFKCFHQDLKEGTAQTVKSAFKHLWENAKGELYRGRWHFNKDSNRWEGNPALSAEVDDTMKAVKNKSGAEGGDRTHAVAMSKEHMEKMFEWSEKMCPKESLRIPAETMEEQGHRTKHLLFRAFAATAWTIWTRCFELIKLQRKHLQLNVEDPSTFGLRYHLLILIGRKGWQRKLNKTQQGDPRGNKYKIYPQKDLPACDSFTLLETWIEYLEKEIYKRPLGPDDYIFPAMGANKVVQRGEMITADTIQKYINEFTSGAGISTPVGSFTTHTFRRGGAQYRFMFAPVGKRWTLKQVRWWGGWAEGEQRDTLIRYLLDELHSYEEDCSDSLCPVQKERDISFMGEHRSIAPITNETFHVMHAQISLEMRSEIAVVKDSLNHITTYLSRMNMVPVPAPAPSMRSTVNPATPAATNPIYMVPGQYHQPGIQHLQATNSVASSSSVVQGHAMAAVSGPVRHEVPTHPHFFTPMVRKESSKLTKKLPTHDNIIPDLPITNNDGTKSLKKDSWRIIVDHWLKGDPARGLNKPLKDWPQEYLRGPNKPLFGTKHHQRAMIATEYINRYHSNPEEFVKAYPVANEGHSKLFSAIEAARIERGEITARPRAK